MFKINILIFFMLLSGVLVAGSVVDRKSVV